MALANLNNPKLLPLRFCIRKPLDEKELFYFKTFQKDYYNRRWVIKGGFEVQS
jgi:hypothetical protein